MGKIGNLFFIILGVVCIYFAAPKVDEISKSQQDKLYRGRDGATENGDTARLFGGKKAYANLLWMKQIISVGGGDATKEDIVDLSSKISYIDPYFISNYVFSGGVVGLIRIYNDLESAMELIKKGLEYNPGEKDLKFYMSGILAKSKGDLDGVLYNFEEILKTTKDEQLLMVVSYIYETKYEKSKDKKFLIKAFYYWSMLLDSKDDKYREKVMGKMEKYKKKVTKKFEKYKKEIEEIEKVLN